MKKKVISMVLALSMAVSLMACTAATGETKNTAQNQTEAQTKAQAESRTEAVKENAGESTADTKGGKSDLKIGMVTYMMAQEWYQNIVAGAQEKADAIGAELTVADANNDASKQVELVENMITKDVDAIIISPVDTKSLINVVKKAQEQGIKVVCESNMVEGADTRVGIPDKECGITSGNWFAEYVKANNIDPKILILGYESLENCKNRTEGFKEALEKSGIKYEIVSEVDGGFREESMNATIDALTAHPDINAVFGINDDSTLGAVSAIRQVGSGNDFVTMLYGVEGAAGREALKSDDLVTAGLCSFPEYVGSVCVDAAVDAVGGNAKEEYISPTTVIEKKDFDQYFSKDGDSYKVNFEAVDKLNK